MSRPLDLDFLTSPRGEALLARLATTDLRDTLTLLSALRRDHSAAEAASALTLAQLRRDARAKFGDAADRLFFTRPALEQASDPLARAWRAAQIAASIAPPHVVDLTCGIGADALAFADAGLQVTALEIDPERARLAALNAAALGHDGRVTVRVGDAIAEGARLAADAGCIYLDPARRREDGSRVFRLDEYAPSPTIAAAWGAPTLIKLAPGVDPGALSGAFAGGTIAFVSAAGDLKEALLFWRLPAIAEARAANRDGIARIAVRLDPDAPPLLLSPAGGVAPLRDPGAYLIEPDPAVLRAGAVGDLALLLGAAQMDESIAYLTSDSAPATRWARTWRVRDWLPFAIKPLRARLRAMGVGRVTVKKRGSPITPEALIAQLKLPAGDHGATIVLTRRADAPIAILCDEQPLT